MKPSLNQQAILRIEAALLGLAAIDGRVFRDRTVPISRDETPCITIRRVREQKSAASRAADSAVFTAHVGVHVRGEPWTDIADPIAVQVHQVLCGDQQLAELVASVRNTASEWDDHEADESAGCLTLEYEFRYTTRASDITNSNIL